MKLDDEENADVAIDQALGRSSGNKSEAMRNGAMIHS
jgi:hypothetical protein